MAKINMGTGGDNIITYLINPSEHIIKRLIILFSILFLALMIDGFFGFSDFYFAKSKAETLNQISICLKDTTISANAKSELKADYERVLTKKSYKVILLNLLKSFGDSNIRSSLSNNNNITKIAKPENNSFIKRISDSIFIKVFFYFLTGGSLYFLMALVLFGAYKRERDKALTNERKRIVIRLFFLGVLVAMLMLLLPPYTISGLWRYMVNLMYCMASIMIIILLKEATE